MQQIKATDVRRGMKMADDRGNLFKVTDVRGGFVHFDTPAGRSRSVIITYEDGLWEQVPSNSTLQAA